MELVNCTGDPILLKTSQGELLIPPSGHEACLEKQTTPHDMINVDGHCISIARFRLGDVVGLPDPQQNTYYLVHASIAHAANRIDVLTADDAQEGLLIPEAAVLYKKGNTSEILRMVEMGIQRKDIADILGITTQAIGQAIKRHQKVVSLTANEKNLVVDALNGILYREGIPYKFHIVCTVVDGIKLDSLDTKWLVEKGALFKKLEKMTEAQAKKIYEQLSKVGD